MMAADDALIKRELSLLMQLDQIEVEEDFTEFLTYIHDGYDMQWFHRAIAVRCQQLLDGTLGKDRLMVFMPPQHGKLLAVDTPVLTSTRGWVAHGDLQVGDYVFAPDGSPTMVLAVTAPYPWVCRRVVFAQGAPLIASYNHEWGCYIPDASHRPVYHPAIETDALWRARHDRNPYLHCEKSGTHTITAVEPAGTVVGNCIQVAGGYYLAGRELRPTHNSEIVSRALPAWAMGRNPDVKIVGTSYSSDLATQFSRAIQRTIATARYAAVFPHTRLGGGRGDSKGYRRNADLFEIVNHHGFYKAVGVGGSLTGTPADIAIIDDPVKDAMEAYSATYRDRVWEWYNSVLLTRLHNTSKQLLIMTRWHEDDLAGRILAHEAEKWDVISIPALCEVEDDGGLHSGRHIDEALWESHHSQAHLLEVRARSATVFASLYQQRPVIEGGNIVKRDWFNVITPEAFRRQHIPYTVHFYLDTAYNKRKTSVDNDPSGILAACRINKQIYLLHAAQVWMEMPDLLRFLPEYVHSHGGTAESILNVEPKANGLSVIQMLKETSTLNVRQTAVPKDSKEARLRAVTPRIECGRVTIVQDSWSEAFLDEVCAFPSHPHDEFVDILVYALNDLCRDDDIDWSEATKYFLI